MPEEKLPIDGSSGVRIDKGMKSATLGERHIRHGGGVDESAILPLILGHPLALETRIHCPRRNRAHHIVDRNTAPLRTESLLYSLDIRHENSIRERKLLRIRPSSTIPQGTPREREVVVPRT